MLPFGILYSLTLILCGLSPDARLLYGGAVVVLLAAVAVGHVGWLFVVPALGYVALTAWMVEWRVAPWLSWCRRALWLVASLAGGLYGLADLWSGRLLWAVLVHWGLNLAHLALFT
ncbi:hypothetical protein [Halomonas nitroreducens]|uniref:CPBP family intramembrane metalloprotease n=1 Tax=Halomonas nitroreducens TaxID=447425 RepID=A0A431V0J1_9GAMM|nr:hypothetical protein [Halomonas nitroreducens]RTR01076.1 hypothetical protein EKG36_14515 [Halomonas nitroreducens]